ncbi:MBL fold metallo-hydrolase [Brooklawnia cerclae]|uniref:Hydroxyacylglutathione hydrolase n=1 Tax=Brooklawnia cerclae TaxID=349934 RepID=A0ABX0SE35_9ACTN|nr:MBL fold metallo-hydrolase [Brooklawnia cerclae]NIH56619.1 hydroxyacylglutathione hydrolase [Brooklawnia cerclae]
MGVKVVPIETRWAGFINYCYLLVDEDAREAALVDPSWDYGKIMDVLDAQGVVLRYILVTHSHLDHINLVRRFSERFPAASVVLSREEHDQSGFGEPGDRYVRDGERLPLGRGHIGCMVTPGHTRGSTCYLWEDNLFTGDTLFPDGCGICESHAAASALFDSVRRILSVVDPSTRLYSGHCYHVANGLTFERAMKTNIYLQIDSRETFCGFRMRPGQKNLFAFGSLACEED